ncbi:S41 family peptidase [Maribacter sp. 2308TA10-17]|uniref:S41 family peptidase n=1 Tax=Maribacter sp. 2308TA10-17 TaxID=3386276 RepID=UPI0039BCD9F1
MKKYLLLLLAFGLIVTSCKKNDNDVPTEIAEEEQEETPVVKTRADYRTQDFIWQIMNINYFWQEDVADLADDKFTSLDEDPSYVEFLAQGADDPADFFYNLCFEHKNIVGDEAATDRFSRLTDDYNTLLQNLQGVSKSNGLKFGLGTITGTNNLFGLVRYVLPDSDAAGKDIKRGDFFTGVNGVDLTQDNYRELLFGDADTYILNLARLDNGFIENTGQEVSLTKEENFGENPIQLNQVIERGGNKIGYLMYNSFAAAYDEDLNNAIGELKTAGINELILDLRYNGGGRLTSALQLASSIYGTKTDELFVRNRWNSKIQPLVSTENLETNFTDKTIDGSVINELNLTQLYVITSGSTASASELIINGLEPYVKIIQVGDKTVGKNEFSLTFIDDLDGNIVLTNTSTPNVNPENQWALTPLCGRVENADGFSDYTSGFTPEHQLREDLGNLGILGDLREPLLALTLAVIDGTVSKSNFEPIYPIETFSSSEEFNPLNNAILMNDLADPVFMPNRK